MELDSFSDQMSPPPAEENGWEVRGEEGTKHWSSETKERES